MTRLLIIFLLCFSFVGLDLFGEEPPAPPSNQPANAPAQVTEGQKPVQTPPREVARKKRKKKKHRRHRRYH
ncbi:MAG: hypothetical protein HY537_15120 [Deltaproteobacteria bacterium]|nr:hypothetical protein [Deltaproteobacteria bacterium]